jgi:hypothetical protein
MNDGDFVHIWNYLKYRVENWYWVSSLNIGQGTLPFTSRCFMRATFHAHLTLSLLMSHICGVSKKFGEREWYQKTNKTEDTNKLTVRRQSNNVWQLFCDRFLKRPLLTVSRSFINVANRVLWRMASILKANKVNLFVSSVLSVLWYHSPNVFRHTTYMELLVKPEILTSYIYGPTFGKAEIRLFLFAAQCFNTESMQKGCPNYRWDLIR